MGLLVTPKSKAIAVKSNSTFTNIRAASLFSKYIVDGETLVKFAVIRLGRMTQAVLRVTQAVL